MNLDKTVSMGFNQYGAISWSNDKPLKSDEQLEYFGSYNWSIKSDIIIGVVKYAIDGSTALW